MVRLRLQSTSISLDEFSLPGWRDDFMAHGRVGDYQSCRRSVVPERVADALLDKEDVVSEADYFTLTHLDDTLMTEQEIRELPKVWVVGGDGAFGDIGFQNVSKVILQNRPNVKLLMLDTQVYSNTGGQNSDSSTMLGGYDMNQFGVASKAS